MSDVLIKGMEMPTDEDEALVVVLYENGRVRKALDFNIIALSKETTTAQELPPHGILKDIDVLNDAIIEAVRLGEITGGEAGFFKAILTNAPTVIDTSKH